MVFSQDVVANFCRFLSRHCGGFLPQHKGFAGFGKGLRGRLSVLDLFCGYPGFGEGWRGRGWSFIRRYGSNSLPAGGFLRLILSIFSLKKNGN